MFNMCSLQQTPYFFHGIFPKFIKQKTKKMRFWSKIKIWKKIFFSPTVAWYTWPPMLAKSQNSALLTCSNYIQIWSIWYFFRITQGFRCIIFRGFQFRCSGAETRLALVSIPGHGWRNFYFFFKFLFLTKNAYFGFLFQ